MKHPVTGKSVRTTGPNAAYMLRTGKVMPKNRKAYRSCQQNDCVNPDHLRIWTREEHGRWIHKQGTWKNQATRIKANTSNKRKNAKLDIEKARAIRASEESPTALALRYDVPKSTIWAVRVGKLWREFGNSVFTWSGRAA